MKFIACLTRSLEDSCFFVSAFDKTEAFIEHVCSCAYYSSLDFDDAEWDRESFKARVTAFIDTACVGDCLNVQLRRTNNGYHRDIGYVTCISENIVSSLTNTKD